MSELRRPRGLQVVESNDSFGRFAAAPFERGYGVTIGNALRRVLLDSMRGAAVTAVRFTGVRHEMSTVAGVKEDTLDMILNIKMVPLRLHGDAPRTIRLRATEPGTVTSKDIDTDPNVEILDPRRPYRHADPAGRPRNRDARQERARPGCSPSAIATRISTVDYIPLDSSHSPVRKVNYRVDPARVGQDTDLDRLVIDVLTNGSVHPQDAMRASARILREMLGIFSGGETESSSEVVVNEDQLALETHGDKPIEDISDRLSVRAFNGLKNAEIATIGDLVSKTGPDLIKERNIGRKSIEEIETVLGNMGLRLGMGDLT